uniref:Auxin response factor n=1 Tax=Eucommia ulmoides TaxID=4392 RepID=A0A649UIM2_EUCUL|nr:ARF2.2 [Eucommia ulmoides]
MFEAGSSSHFKVGAQSANCNGDFEFRENEGGEDNLSSQLWLLCAGPLVNVPRGGDKVYYFPQGHIEQVVAYMNQDEKVDMPIYNLPSKILCKVVHVELKAEANTDEVFAQITLLPEEEEPSSEHEFSTFMMKNGHAHAQAQAQAQARSFSKKLTPSDISTHGGFSVPKRYADDCFPPLDMSQQPPTQELVAKDLNGSEWHFRHIYRGHPRRHLLTSGWSTFVSVKKLVPGDDFNFLRGENGELYVGVRRSKKPRYSSSASILSSLSMQHGILASAFHAISTGTMFTVYYRPWTCPVEFVIPYDRYMKSVEYDYSFGTRFKMRFENVNGIEQIFSGNILGSEDIDSVRWPDSEWRSLKVRWDATPESNNRPDRVSPWNIEPIGALKMKKRKSVQSHEKRKRHFDPLSPFIINDGLTKNPVGVLQGQENKATATAKCMLFGVDILNNRHTELPSIQIFGSPKSSTSQTQTVRVSELGNNVSCSRTCTKQVQKYGTALGRSIDLARFGGYNELIVELDRMFEFEGKLVNGSSGWQVTYTDIEGDMMLIGDYPWLEFLGMVQKMFIQPKEEVDKADSGAPE